MTDEELIAGCLLGSKDSWDFFCERFSKLIHWSIRRTLDHSSYRGRREILDDIFQDVFKRLLVRNELAKLKEAVSVRKFLCVMACNTAIDRVRVLRRHEARLSDPMDEPPPEGGFSDTHPATEAGANECREILRRTLEALKPKERSVLESFYLDGLSHKTISERWGLSVDGVEALIRRTREKLKQALGEKGMEGA